MALNDIVLLYSIKDPRSKVRDCDIHIANPASQHCTWTGTATHVQPIRMPLARDVNSATATLGAWDLGWRYKRKLADGCRDSDLTALLLYKSSNEICGSIAMGLLGMDSRVSLPS